MNDKQNDILLSTLTNKIIELEAKNLELTKKLELNTELPIPFDFKKERLRLGLTLRQVEEETGINNGYLSQVENNKIKCPRFDVIKKLYELYGLKLTETYNGNELRHLATNYAITCLGGNGDSFEAWFERLPPDWREIANRVEHVSH